MLDSSSKLWRGAKTVFFLLAMTTSLLVVCAPPLLVVLLDVLLPSALLSASSHSFFSLPAILSQLRNFDFRVSLADLFVVSAARSFLILCTYSLWDGRGPYLAIATASSFFSAGYVCFKAACVYGVATAVKLGQGDRRYIDQEDEGSLVTDALFLSSVVLAMAHIAVAYKTSWRKRRQLLVYRIDIEAVPSFKSDFINSHHKVALSK